jgi:twinkle protein
VPDGAPPPGAKSYASKFRFLESAEEILAKVPAHLIAVDSDEPGRALEEELSRRLGREKCKRVTWPDGCKDANEVLVTLGRGALLQALAEAKPYPIEGVFEIIDRGVNVHALYRDGFERGHATGWERVDQLYTVRPGEFTVITGVPSSGKSNWLDCLLVNLAEKHDWNFALFSPENLPLEQHMAAIIEKRVRRPFHRGPNARMTEAELDEGMAWAQEHFAWIMPSQEDHWTIGKILDAARQLCLRRGIRGLVIDPWNELESQRPPSMSETEYISHALKRARVFARSQGIHLWIVVHPAKLTRSPDGKYPIPTLYDCAGSAHWRNKADNGIVVWRDLSQEDSPAVQIHVQKIRFRQIGKRGMAELYYEPSCATYGESMPQPPPPREREMYP